MVFTNDRERLGGATRSETITGILRVADGREIRRMRDWPRPQELLERRYYLDAEARLGFLYVDIFVVLIAALLFGAWNMVMLKRGIIFETRADAPLDLHAAHAAPSEARDLRASGKFKSGNMSARLLDFPVTMLERAPGRFVLVGTDCSQTSLFGMKRETQLVEWSIELSEARSIKPGFQYLGPNRKPAIRWIGRAGEKFVLSFRDDTDRARFVLEAVAHKAAAA